MADMFETVREAATASLAEVQTPATATAPESTTPASAETPSPSVTAEEAKKWKLKDPEGEFEVDEEELKNGHLRFRDYTRKTQAVAEERKALESTKKALAEREQRINELLSDKNNVAQYYEFLTGEKLTPSQQARVEQGKTPNPGGNPDEVATLAEAERIANERVGALQEKLEKEMLEKLARTHQLTQEQIIAAQQQAEMRQTAAKYQADISTTITALSDQFPLLRDTYDAQELEDLLCRDVMKAEPKSLEETKQLLLSAAKERHARLERVVISKKKEDAVAKAALETQGIEPKGGAVAGAPAVKHRLGSKELTQSAISFMESYKK